MTIKFLSLEIVHFDSSYFSIDQQLFLEVPPDPSLLSPPPLEEGVSLEFYERCLAPKPPPTLPEADKVIHHNFTHVHMI